MDWRAVSLLTLVCLVTLCTSAFLPDGRDKVGDIPDPPSYLCPTGCQCDTEHNNAQCRLAYSQYAFDALLPWQLSKLKVLGNAETLRQPYRYSSLKSVLKGEDRNSFFNMENFHKVFSSVSYLEINYFPLSQISVDDFADFVELKTLDIGYNNISELGVRSFKNQAMLHRLTLNGNHIESLYDNVFSGLSRLTHLYLESNGLDYISSLAFSGLDSLQILSLKNNNIQSLETFIIGLSHLSKLHLDGNKISYVLNESVQVLNNIEEVTVGANPFECSCVVKALAEAMRMQNSSINSRDVICSEPQNLEGVKLSALDLSDLPCDKPTVTTISEAMDIPYHTPVTLSCAANGTSPIGTYWLTPWGDTFASTKVQRRFPEILLNAKSDSTLQGINVPMKSRVHVTPDGYLHLENFRGLFRGNFTCVAVGYLGVTNSSVTVHMHTSFPEVYMASIFVATYSTCAMLTLAIIIGTIRWFVYKCLQSHGPNCQCCCCRSDEPGIEEKCVKIEPIEVVYSSTDGCGNTEDSDYQDFDSLPPPCPPVNSPQRLSPDKSVTPSEEGDKLPPHIWEQLDEVRLRLRDGAERKMERMRSHVRSFTDTGSLKIREIKDAGTLRIQSIKESGSQAASSLKKNVASGMVQVKYGVQSIKEFCGTGEMGTGTVSMVSVSTDVDTKEQVKIVKSHTFV